MIFTGLKLVRAQDLIISPNGIGSLDSSSNNAADEVLY
jgi:hypothetical protein